MKKIAYIIGICFTMLLYCACQDHYDETEPSVSEETPSSDVESVTEEISAEETKEVFLEEEETEQAEEVQNVPVSVEFNGFNRVDEREALDLVYNYLYEDFEYKEYSVYMDEIDQNGVSKKGYIVGQYTYQYPNRIYEEYTPEVEPGVTRRLELVYEGLSQNEFFYIFSEWYMRVEDDGNLYREISDYIAISVDGKMIIQQREGDQWLAYDKLTGESTLVSSDDITCHTYAFCITKFELSDGVLTVIGNDGSANGWKVEPISISYPLSSDCEWVIGSFGYYNGADSYFVKKRDISYEEIKGWTEQDYTGEEIQSPNGIYFYISDGCIKRVLVLVS